ncbi:protein MRG2 isoform X1 [Cicer arietinum]|uniref:Protein MRG2 isoform X1 n=1 Tax=Cicer arietinum TaxID=3827 RepID=A0A1S2Y9L4_CICAR|nr:protein MRG2 isoform X1 [Cicer arietinum]
MENSKTNSDVSENSNSNSSSNTEIENYNISVSPYTEGEKVFAYHTTCIYEAKVRQIEYKHKRWRFYLHYLGWKKSWDEWVVLDRLMKHTEENMRIKLALDEKYGNDKNARKPRASSKASNGARGRKRKNDSVIKEKSGVLPDKLVNILIPLTLKKQLVDDFEFITHLGKLVKLPRTPNVNDIFKKYFDYRLKKSGSISDSAEEIMKGLCCYFDKALPVMLLYNNEREQYQEACPNNTVPSSIYGAEHLLRLFVKLPELLIHANIEGDTLIELQTQILDFLRFLRKSQRSFFLSSYHVPEDIENNINKQLFCIAHNIT